MGTVVDDAAAAEFHAFFEAHYAELARLAHLLTGEADAADDLAADALMALWHRWDRVRGPTTRWRTREGSSPTSPVRASAAPCVSAGGSRCSGRPAGPGTATRRTGPTCRRWWTSKGPCSRLPFRKRACVVLRHAFDLSERDTALVLGVSVGTVKSQTSRGVAELQRLLGHGTPAAQVQVAAAGQRTGGRQ